MEFLQGLFGSAVTGGLSGLLGVGLQQFFTYKQKQQDIEIVKLNLENSLQLAKIETDRQLQVTKIVAEGATEVAKEATLQAQEQTLVRTFEATVGNDHTTYTPLEAFKLDNWATRLGTFMLAAVDALRGVVRPLMTFYLCGLTSAMFLWSSSLAQQQGVSLDADQVVALMQQIISTVLYVFTTVCVFWFGGRAVQQNK